MALVLNMWSKIMNTLNPNQLAEIAKYEDVYHVPDTYVMGLTRRRQSDQIIAALPRGSYFDVGCGIGVTMQQARVHGHSPVAGCDIIERLAEAPDVLQAVAWDLPLEDKAWDTVAAWDVIEHLLPGDDELAVREWVRVCKNQLIITASNVSSIHCGHELHVNMREYEEWDRLLRAWVPHESVEWNRELPSPVWTFRGIGHYDEQ